MSKLLPLMYHGLYVSDVMDGCMWLGDIIYMIVVDVDVDVVTWYVDDECKNEVYKWNVWIKYDVMKYHEKQDNGIDSNESDLMKIRKRKEKKWSKFIKWMNVIKIIYDERQW